MRTLLSAVFAAAFLLVVGAENESPHGVDEEVLQRRLQLMSEIEKLELWGVLTAVQQERLRQAVVQDKRPPQLWSRIAPYERIVKPDTAPFLWRLTHLAPHLRDFYMDKLPPVAHEDVLEAASGRPWWPALSLDEQRALARLILAGRKVPKGWDTWKRAVHDERFGHWIRTNRDILST